MAPTETLPAADACLDLYATLYDCYGTDAFDRDDLSRPTDDESLTRRLELLVAYGLVDRRADGDYQVRCSPDESLDRWRAKGAARCESLYHRIQRTTPAGDDASDHADSETVTREDRTFAGVRVTDSADFDSVRATLRTAMANHPECDGVVLRSSGVGAAAVQRLADELCASGTPAGRQFEKEATALVGEEKNALEFRLFLRER